MDKKTMNDSLKEFMKSMPSDIRSHFESNQPLKEMFEKTWMLGYKTATITILDGLVETMKGLDVQAWPSQN